MKQHMDKNRIQMSQFKLFPLLVAIDKINKVNKRLISLSYNQFCWWKNEGQLKTFLNELPHLVSFYFASAVRNEKWSFLNPSQSSIITGIKDIVGWLWFCFVCIYFSSFLLEFRGCDLLFSYAECSGTRWSYAGTYYIHHIIFIIMFLYSC